MEGRRRLTLLEQMSASSNGRALAGLSLDDVLIPRPHKPPPPAPAIPESISGRTLLDIIRDEEPNSYQALIGKEDKKPRKTFKDRLRLKKGSNAWVSSARVPTSDIHPFRNNYHHQGYSYSSPRRHSVTYVTPEPQPMEEPGENADNTPAPTPGPIIRSGSNPSFTRRSSVRLSAVDDVESPRRRREAVLGEDRSLSAREAVAAQQATEAAAAAAEAAQENAEGGEGDSSSENVSGGIVTLPEPEPVRMSLMDLLEETDRQMGLEGSRYTMESDEEDEDEDEEEEEEEEEVAAEEGGGGVEHSCCVCMVRHKGAAFIPCGHTFCRTCSKELLAQRGNCPLCNNYILEILNIF